MILRLIALLEKVPSKRHSQSVARLARFLRPGSDHSEVVSGIMYRHLDPLIQSLARCVGLRIKPYLADDFAEEATSQLLAPQLRSDGRTLALPRLMEYNPRRSELRRWLERILTNLFISHYCRPFYFRRSRFLEHLPETFTCQPEYFDPEPALLAEHDLDILEIWSARKRLLILLISGLWEKVPLRRRWAWSQEFSAILAADLPTQAYTPKERIRVYSKLLGISRNRLSQEWSRSRGDLEGLKLIRNLRKI